MPQRDPAEHRPAPPSARPTSCCADPVRGRAVRGSGSGRTRPAQSLTWVAAMVLFYVPMAASVICLNRRMPLEGGLTSGPAKPFRRSGRLPHGVESLGLGLAVTATDSVRDSHGAQVLIGPRGRVGYRRIGSALRWRLCHDPDRRHPPSRLSRSELGKLDPQTSAGIAC